MAGEDKIKTCDKCKMHKFGNYCGCSFWVKNEPQPQIGDTLERAIQCYKYVSLMANDPSPMFGYNPSGVCMVIFDGNQEDLDKVRDFMAKELKKEIKK